MSVMDDESGDPIDPLHNALILFTHAIGASLTGICSYGLTLGDSYTPFRPDEDEDCDEDEEACSQAWVRVQGIAPKPTRIEGWGGDCALVMTASLEVGVLRCFDIPEDGEAPTTTEVMLASMEALTDMDAILAAALNTEVWDNIDIGTWTPVGPMGAQYGGTWTFDVEFSQATCVSGNGSGYASPGCSVCGSDGGSGGGTGPAGPPGPAGPAGPAHGSYEYVQAVNAATWTITHNLNARPLPTILLSADPTRPVITDTDYPDGNTLVLTFPTPVSGRVYL